jgi:hypothetical protein
MPGRAGGLSPTSPQQCLYFRPLPHGHDKFLPILIFTRCNLHALTLGYKSVKVNYDFVKNRDIPINNSYGGYIPVFVSKKR